MLKHLLEDQQVDVNMTDDYGTTALLGAARQNQLKAAEMLLAHDANMEQPGPDGMTPLHGAARKGHADIVELLLHGANRKAVDCNGRTAYALATEHGHHTIAQKILPQRH